MSEARLARARRSLPEGYQFGDARPIGYEHWTVAYRRGDRLMVKGTGYSTMVPCDPKDCLTVGEVVNFYPDLSADERARNRETLLHNLKTLNDPT